MPPCYPTRDSSGQSSTRTRKAVRRHHLNSHSPTLPSTGSTAPSALSVAEIIKLVVSFPLAFTLTKLGATRGPSVLGTPTKVFCQSTTPASDSCKAQTGDIDSVRKSKREVAHSEERVCMTQLDRGRSDDDGPH